MSTDEFDTVLDGTGVTANTWQSAARRLAAEVRELRAERDDFKAKYAELEGAHSWGTTCLGCASGLDKSYGEYARGGTAELARTFGGER